MPPSMTDSTTRPSLELIYYWMYTKHRHELRQARKAWPGTLVDPCLLFGYNRPWPTDRYIPSPTILDMFSNHSWCSHDFHFSTANKSKVTVPAEEMTNQVKSSHVDTKENWRDVQDMSSCTSDYTTTTWKFSWVPNNFIKGIAWLCLLSNNLPFDQALQSAKWIVVVWDHNLTFLSIFQNPSPFLFYLYSALNYILMHPFRHGIPLGLVPLLSSTRTAISALHSLHFYIQNSGWDLA